MQGNLKTEWGRLTDNDRRQLDGKFEQMVGLVQERYGYTRRSATKLLTRYLRAYGKRSHSRAHRPTRMWFPAMTLVGVFGLSAVGWFFFSRFLAESPDLTPEQVTESEYLTSPEAELV